MLRAALALALAFAWLGVDAASAQRRLALVIGVTEYRELPRVVRSAGDARAVRDALTGIGFAADLALDPDAGALDEALDRFTASLRRDDIALVYFTGHGARVRGDFVLLPADAPGMGGRPDDDPRRRYGIALHALADEIKAAGASAQVLVADACRGDPYAGDGRDLAVSDCGEVGQPLPVGSFALFSASSGQKTLDRLAQDDRDPNSLFTRVLLRRIPEVRSVVRLARVVRDEVVEIAASVNDEQRPSYLDELTGSPLLLAPRDREVVVAPPPRLPAPEPIPAEPAPRRRAEVLECGAVAPGPPAFTCGGRRNLVEAMICREPRLGSCDRVLNDVFERAQAQVGRGAAALRREEDAWVVRRDACGRVAPQGAEALIACIGRSYQERIAELEAIAASPPAAPALATPSFDCRYAGTPVERAICADPVLAAKDRRMSSLYAQANALHAGALGPAQDDWRAARDACARRRSGLEACVEEAYDARIRELRQLRAGR